MSRCVLLIVELPCVYYILGNGVNDTWKQKLQIVMGQLKMWGLIPILFLFMWLGSLKLSVTLGKTNMS